MSLRIPKSVVYLDKTEQAKLESLKEHWIDVYDKTGIVVKLVLTGDVNYIEVKAVCTSSRIYLKGYYITTLAIEVEFLTQLDSIIGDEPINFKYPIDHLAPSNSIIKVRSRYNFEVDDSHVKTHVLASLEATAINEFNTCNVVNRRSVVRCHRIQDALSNFKNVVMIAIAVLLYSM